MQPDLDCSRESLTISSGSDQGGHQALIVGVLQPCRLFSCMEVSRYFGSCDGMNPSGNIAAERMFT